MKRTLIISAIALLAVAGLVAAVLYSAITSRVEGQHFDSNGVRIHFTDEGAGDPVILIHGFGAHADYNWREPGVTDALAETYRVIAVDVRGHGLSEKPHDPGAYGEEMALDIVRLMDHLDIEQARVAGYSMGGMITMKLLTLAPERLVCAAPCAFGWPRLSEDRKHVVESLAESLESGQGFAPLLMSIQALGEEVNRVQFAATDALLQAVNDERALAAVVRSWPEMIISEEAIRGNDVPTLTIIGARDPLRVDVERMEGRMANHRALYLADLHHLDTPRARKFVETLKAFFAAPSDFLQTLPEPDAQPPYDDPVLEEAAEAPTPAAA